MKAELNQSVEQIRDSTGQGIAAEGEVSLDGSGALMETVESNARSFDVSGFKCTECGLAHMHDTNKHRASDSFDVSEDAVADMEYNANCHCGVNELARHGSDFGVDEHAASQTAGCAPIPDETTREMDERFGPQ